MPDDVVFLFDVDNTLVDNDRVQDDLRDYLTEHFGRDSCEQYWSIFEELRSELGYADYLGALQRYRVRNMHEPRLLAMSSFLIDYPFRERLYPRALDTVSHCSRAGRVVILSDGDVVFQPRKVERSGLWKAFDGHVLIYIHKEQELADVERRYPARHYVLVDDKLRILDAVKRAWGDRVTTVFPRQGHYARDTKLVAAYPPADVTVGTIGQLLDHNPEALARSAERRPAGGSGNY
jgi:FMN phosphatase YigB (HAD superfamily)